MRYLGLVRVDSRVAEVRRMMCMAVLACRTMPVWNGSSERRRVKYAMVCLSMSKTCQGKAGSYVFEAKMKYLFQRGLTKIHRGHPRPMNVRTNMAS